MEKQFWEVINIEERYRYRYRFRYMDMNMNMNLDIDIGYRYKKRDIPEKTASSHLSQLPKLVAMMVMNSMGSRLP